MGLVVVKVFQRSGASVFHGLGQRHGRGAKLGAHLLRQHRGGRFLPHLLAPPLQRTLALEAMDGALAVAQDLHLDVAGLLDHLLDIEAAIAEGRLGFGAGLRHQGLELAEIMGHADAAATAAGRRLDHHREADGLGHQPGALGIIDTAIGARHDGYARCFGRGTCRHLVAHDADGLAFGPHEDESGRLYRIRKIGVLGQETIARMHRVGAGVLGCLQNVVDVEIGLRRMRRTDVHRLVGHLHRQRVGIGQRMDLNRPDAKLLRRTNDAHGDFATVGNEELRDRHDVRRSRPAPGPPLPVPRSRR